MKLLLIILLFPLLSKAQDTSRTHISATFANVPGIFFDIMETTIVPLSSITPKDIFIGEYANYILYENGEVYTYIKNKRVKFPIPEQIETGSAGHPYGLMIAKSGNVYLLRSGDLKVTKLNVTTAVTSSSWYNRHVIVLSDGSVKVFDDLGVSVNLIIPEKIKDVSASKYLIALTESGNVYQYNWIQTGKIVYPHEQLKNLNPIKINLPAPATLIASGVIQSAVVAGDPWVWTDNYGARFVKNTAGALPPTNFRSRMNNSEPVIDISASDNILGIVTSAGRAMTLGNTWVGEIGNGSQAPKITETNVSDFAHTQYFYNFVDISQGRKYTRFISGSYYGFRHFILEQGSVDTIHEATRYRLVIKEPVWSSWGYSKFGLLTNGITPQDDPANVAKLSVRTPRRISFTETSTLVTTSQGFSMLAAGTYPPPEQSVSITYSEWVDKIKVLAICGIYEVLEDGTWRYKK